MQLLTDIVNLGQVNAHHLRQAVIFYRERIDLGHKPREARPQALAYLRRKTHWPEAMAAGALDYELHRP